MYATCVTEHIYSAAMILLECGADKEITVKVSNGDKAISVARFTDNYKRANILATFLEFFVASWLDCNLDPI